jgi:hypothetical protein
MPGKWPHCLEDHAKSANIMVMAVDATIAGVDAIIAIIANPATVDIYPYYG